MSRTVVGIDISKAKFDVALFLNEKPKHKKFDNTPVGFSQFHAWLHSFPAENYHICMEATGIYGEALALFLVEGGYTVSVVNPAQIKGFARGELTRTKTDKADAKLIARFCLAMNPAPWFPAPLAIRELQALVRRLESLQDMYQQETNRLESASEIVRPSIETISTILQEEIKEVKEKMKQHIDNDPTLRDKKKLLETIPGVGDATLSYVLAFIEVDKFESAKKVAAFVGLNPQQHLSGTSVKGRTRLSKIGDARLRKALYMPAIVAKRYNPVVHAFCERLKANGKSVVFK